MTARSRSPKKVRSYHKGNVAEDLHSAAVKLLETENHEDISVRRLCQIVGVTPANFYNHYPSLNYLLQKIAADGFRQLLRMRQAVLKAAKTRQEAARNTAAAYLEFAFANKQTFRLMFGQIPDSMRDPTLREASDEGFSDFVQMVYGTPNYNPDDIPASHEKAIVAYAFFALLYGLARLSMEGQFYFHTGKKTEMLDFVTAAADTFITGSCAIPFAEGDTVTPGITPKKPLRSTSGTPPLSRRPRSVNTGLGK